MVPEVAAPSRWVVLAEEEVVVALLPAALRWAALVAEAAGWASFLDSGLH